MLINAGVILLADQVAKLVTRQDDGFAVRRLAHLHRGLTPLSVGKPCLAPVGTNAEWRWPTGLLEHLFL